MIPAAKLFIAGCVVGACAGLTLGIILMVSISDLHASAPLKELQECKSEPDRQAFMARLPGESHSVESCIRVPRYGDPAWIPFMSHPLNLEGSNDAK